MAQQSARRAKHPERTKKQNESYKARFPEKVKAINKAYQQENKEKVNAGAKHRRSKDLKAYAAKTKKWRDENPEKMKAARDAWLDKNKARKKQSEAVWRDGHGDHISIKGRKRYRNKRDHILSLNLAWQKANPHAMKQISARRRARIKGSSVGDVKEIIAWEREWRSKTTAECAYCHQTFHPSDCDTDHIIPISRPEIGGVHALHNLTIACEWCNRSKKDRTVEEWNAVKLPHPKSLAS